MARTRKDMVTFKAKNHGQQSVKLNDLVTSVTCGGPAKKVSWYSTSNLSPGAEKSASQYSGCKTPVDEIRVNDPGYRVAGPFSQAWRPSCNSETGEAYTGNRVLLWMKGADADGPRLNEDGTVRLPAVFLESADPDAGQFARSQLNKAQVADLLGVPRASVRGLAESKTVQSDGEVVSASPTGADLLNELACKQSAVALGLSAEKESSRRGGFILNLQREFRGFARKEYRQLRKSCDAAPGGEACKELERWERHRTWIGIRG
ncbi:MAG: hypothetical protein GY716_12575 [bacterium]|nr:hypothetical protein [bacterium]